MDWPYDMYTMIHGKNIAMQVMHMIVMVLINCETAKIGAEHTQIFRMLANRLRSAHTTHMLLQAHHLIGRRHHQMQIMRHHQHAAPTLITHPGNQTV